MDRRMLRGLLGSAAAIALSGALNGVQAAACSSPYVKGDVFASVGSSTVDVFTPTGTLVCTLDDGAGATYTTGSGFDAAGNFYVTNFGAGTVSKFDNSGGLVASTFMTSNNTPESINNQSTGAYAGLSLVGGPGAALINAYTTATGALVHSYSVTGGNATGGTDWVDTYNPSTGQVIYDGEGTAIRSAILNTDGTVTQLSDFSSAATEAALTNIYAMRTIPSGMFAGDVLVANSVTAVMLDVPGDIINTYALPGNAGGDFSLNPRPERHRLLDRRLYQRHDLGGQHRHRRDRPAVEHRRRSRRVQRHFGVRRNPERRRRRGAGTDLAGIARRRSCRVLHRAPAAARTDLWLSGIRRRLRLRTAPLPHPGFVRQQRLVVQTRQMIPSGA
jgi:hypothetical protein